MKPALEYRFNYCVGGNNFWSGTAALMTTTKLFRILEDGCTTEVN
jgi:hypothetical protein